MPDDAHAEMKDSLDNIETGPDVKENNLTSKPARKPIFLDVRSNVHFITLVVGFGIFCDLCIYGIASPVIPFRLEQLGYQNVSALTGWLVAAYGGGLVVSSPVIGYFGERIQNRQGPLLFCLLFMAGSLVMFMLSKSFALLLVSRILQGISGTGVFTLGLALLADCVEEERIALAMGNALIGMSLGGVSGPPIGGALYRKLGYYAPWIFSIAIIAVDFALRIVIIEPHRAWKWRPGSKPPAKRKPTTLAAYARLLYDPRAAVSFFISFTVGVYFGGVLDSALTLRLNQRYGLDSLGAGLVFIANAVPAAVVGPVAGYYADKYGPKWVALFGVLGTSAVTTLLCIDRMPLAGFAVVLAAIGLFASIPVPALMMDLAMVATETEGVGFAHVFSIFNMAFSIGAFIGPIIAGQVLEHLGIEKGWYTMIGICVFFWLLCAPGILLKFTSKAKIPETVGAA